MARILSWQGRDYHLTRFPLRDYLGKLDPERPPIGSVLIWRDASFVLAQYQAQQQTRRTAILLAYVVAQGLLIWLLRATRRRLQHHIDAAVAAEKQAQQDVARLSQRNEQLLMSVGEGIYGIDLEGRAIFINPAALAMLGLSAEEALGADQHHLFHHHHPDGRPYSHRDCPVRQTLADGQARRIEDEWFWRKDGSGFPVTLTVTPTDKDGVRSGAVVVFQDMTERQAREAELLRLATTDTLTGLANRRCLLEHVEREFARFKRSGRPGALLLLDLDHFKRINDRYGHATGDAVLKHFAHIMQSRVRRIDFVGRLGGEEFVIMLADTPADGARAFAEQLCATVADQPLQGDAGPLHYTVSIGVTLFEPSDSSSETPLARADAALYRAKENGRNRIEVARSGGPSHVPTEPPAVQRSALPNRWPDR